MIHTDRDAVQQEIDSRYPLISPDNFQQTTDYVKARHSQKKLPEFYHCPVVEISTDGTIEETTLEVKRQVWKHL